MKININIHLQQSLTRKTATLSVVHSLCRLRCHRVDVVLARLTLTSQSRPCLQGVRTAALFATTRRLIRENISIAIQGIV